MARGERAATSSAYDSVIVVCGLLSIGIGAVYWLMRIGFDDPVPAVAKPVALALFIFSFPTTVAWRPFRRGPGYKDPRAEWWLSYPFCWLAALGLTGALGRLVPVAGQNPFPLLAIVGLLSFAIVFVRWLRDAPLWRSAALIAGCAGFSVWASGVVWGRIYKDPLFYENFIVDGRIHHDSLALAAIANMLRTYHVASTGADGLNYMPYHWGTPWLFTQWSNLVGSHVLDFYQVGFPVTMIPFFFGGTIAFAVAMRNRRGGALAAQDLRSDFRFWLVFLAACIGVIPISGLDAMGVWTSNLLISESYTVAIPCALLMLATVLIFHDGIDAHARAKASAARRLGDSLFVLIGIPAGIVLLGYLKISLMVLGFALAFFALFRLRFYRRPLYLASAAILTVLFYFAFFQLSLPGHREGLTPFDFLWSFVKPAWWPFFIIAQLFWSWLYVVVRLWSEGVGTLSDLREAATERRILDVEVVAFIAALGLVPGLLVHIDGGSAFYFFDVQRWLAVGLLLSRLPTFMEVLLGERRAPVKRGAGLRGRLDAIRVRSLFLAFILLPMACSMAANSIVWPLQMARANADTRRALYPKALAANIPSGIRGLMRLHDRDLIGNALRGSPNYAVAEVLRSMSRMPDSIRRHTALFIPQDQGAFWHSLTRPGACSFQPLLATALAGLVMIDGMPAYGCAVSRYYGFGSFTARARPQTIGDAAAVSLCSRAGSAGLARVLVLTFDEIGRAKTTSIQCTPRR